VCVGLLHDQVAAHGVELAAVIAGDDARRNARRARHHREGRGEVLAETATGIEQEIVH
jgi:hypothetical protein